jgi:hypothetical protein
METLLAIVLALIDGINQQLDRQTRHFGVLTGWMELIPPSLPVPRGNFPSCRHLDSEFEKCLMECGRFEVRRQIKN